MGAGGAPLAGSGNLLHAEPSEAADTELNGPKERTTSDVQSRGARIPRRQDTVNLGVCLAPLPRKVVERIQAGDVVEFGEFPVVAGTSQESRSDELVDSLLSIGTGERRSLRGRYRMFCYGSAASLYPVGLYCSPSPTGVQSWTYTE